MTLISRLSLFLCLLYYIYVPVKATDTLKARNFISTYKGVPDKFFDVNTFTFSVSNQFCDNKDHTLGTPLTKEEENNLEVLQAFWTNTTHPTPNLKETFFHKVIGSPNYNFHVKRVAFKVLAKQTFIFSFQYNNAFGVTDDKRYELYCDNSAGRHVFEFLMSEKQFDKVVEDMRDFGLTKEQLDTFWSNVMDTSTTDISLGRRCEFAHMHDLFTIPYFSNLLKNRNLSTDYGGHHLFVPYKICLLDDETLKCYKAVNNMISIIGTHYKERLPELLDYLIINSANRVGGTDTRLNSDSLKIIFDNAPPDNSSIRETVKYIAWNHFSKAISVTPGTSKEIVNKQKNDLLFLFQNMKYFVEKSDPPALSRLFVDAAHLMDAMQTVENIENLDANMKVKASNNLLLNRTLEYEMMPKEVPELLIFLRTADFQNSRIYLNLSSKAQKAYIKDFPPMFDTFPDISSTSSNPSQIYIYRYFLKQMVDSTLLDALVSGSGIVTTSQSIKCWEIDDVALAQNISETSIAAFRTVIDTFVDIDVLQRIIEEARNKSVPSNHLEQLSKVIDSRIAVLKGEKLGMEAAGVTLISSSWTVLISSLVLFVFYVV